jgi:hypothetical protein
MCTKACCRHHALSGIMLKMGLYSVIVGNCHWRGSQSTYVHFHRTWIAGVIYVLLALQQKFKEIISVFFFGSMEAMAAGTYTLTLDGLRSSLQMIARICGCWIVFMPLKLSEMRN